MLDRLTPVEFVCQRVFCKWESRVGTYQLILGIVHAIDNTMKLARKIIALDLTFFRTVSVFPIRLEKLQPAVTRARTNLNKRHEIRQPIQGSRAEGMLHLARFAIGRGRFDVQDVGQKLAQDLMPPPHLLAHLRTIACQLDIFIFFVIDQPPAVQRFQHAADGRHLNVHTLGNIFDPNHFFILVQIENRFQIILHDRRQLLFRGLFFHRRYHTSSPEVRRFKLIFRY
ncbi:hypothetical protein DESC_370032 [Desulfosarcina cetonica]|nr:hypothetical protein DESC_370032 [Desulfosarcina cetonica]